MKSWHWMLLSCCCFLTLPLISFQMNPTPPLEEEEEVIADRREGRPSLYDRRREHNEQMSILEQQRQLRRRHGYDCPDCPRVPPNSIPR